MASSVQKCSIDSDIRILLVGKTGHGKSSTANSIIGEEKFEVSVSAKSVTKTTAWSGVVQRYGKSIEVVDTPGIFDTHRSADEIHKELIRSLILATPGFHAIVFVLEIGRFTEELEKTKDLFFDWFGRGVEKYACIILTRTEDKKTMDKYLSEDTTDGLLDLIKRCGGRRRVACIDNKADKRTKETQVKQILDMIEDIKQSNNSTHFSNVAFELATSYAYNKYPDRITQDSIYILQKAGVQMKLSGKECKMLDKIFEIECNSEDMDCGSDFVEQKKRIPRSQRVVDLNSVRFTPMIDQQAISAATDNDNARVTSASNQEFSIKEEEIINKRSLKPRTSKQSNNVDKTKQTSRYVNIPETKSLSVQRIGKSSPRVLDSANQICSSGIEDPENQYVDDGTADTDPLNILKDDVNKDRKKEIKFFKYLKNAIIYGKRKFKCTLL